MSKSQKSEDGKLKIDLPGPSGEPNSKATSPSSAKSVVTLTMELNTLFKFIKPYDGSRETLNSFIVNCNNAYDLATETQKLILFKYIISQLNGKAEVACSIKEFNSWEQLKDFLKTQFSDRKHYSYLLTELQECKQGTSESVNQFALRIETFLSQLLIEVSSSNTKQKELPGRSAAMEDLALHHFLMGLYPRLSNIVRCKSPKTLNEAINQAVSEERIQQTLYKRTQTESKPTNNNNNRLNTRAGPSRGNFYAPNQQRPALSQSQGSTSVFCRYCKIPGHDISACRKREFNNNRYRTQQNPSTNQPARIHFLEQQPNETDEIEQDEVDLPTNLNE